MVYIYEQDPGHGWLKVSYQELQRLGISEKISHYSYRNKGEVFLEEDLDMQVFMEAKRKAGESVSLRRLYVDKTPIRGYQPYSFSIAV